MANISLKKFRKAGLVTTLNQAGLENFVGELKRRYVEDGWAMFITIPEGYTITEDVVLEGVKIRCERLPKVKLDGSWGDLKLVRDIMVYGVLGAPRPSLEDSREKAGEYPDYNEENYSQITAAIS